MSDDLQARKRGHERERRVTVGDLRERLALFDDDAEVTFGFTEDGDPLIFYRLKNRGPLQGPAIVHVELRTLTDDMMENEVAWAWVGRLGELAEAILYVAGDRDARRPSKAQTDAVGDVVRALKADPSLLGGAESFVWHVDDTAANARCARALDVVVRWAGLD